MYYTVLLSICFVDISQRLRLIHGLMWQKIEIVCVEWDKNQKLK